MITPVMVRAGSQGSSCWASGASHPGRSAFNRPPENSVNVRLVERTMA